MNFTNMAINHNIINNTIDLISGTSGDGNNSGGGGSVVGVNGIANTNFTSSNSNYFESSSESPNAFTSSIVSSAMHIRNSFDATRNGTHLIDLKNINITDEDLHDFAKKLLELNQFNLSSENESIACEHYCNGFVKDIFTSYKRMHGYISLAVRTLFNNFNNYKL